MPDEIPSNVVDQHETRRGRTLIEMTHHPDGTWTATQFDVEVVGTGETAPTAALDYCRQIVETQDVADE